MLLFLHGFLGQKEDWEPLLAYLPGKAINLPIEEKDVALAIKNKYGPAKILVGYSAGGRIALELKSRFPNCFGSVFALSAHPGMKNGQEKHARLQKDLHLAHLLKTLPLEDFLKKWYEKPLFESLKKSDAFTALLKRRNGIDPIAWAHFLENNSVGKKRVPDIFPGTVFIYGSKDLKYANLYRRLDSIEIKNAGHAVHLENPEVCALSIKRTIKERVHDNHTRI